MKIEVKLDGYDLVEKYTTEKGKETHIWHFDKNGESELAGREDKEVCEENKWG